MMDINVIAKALELGKSLEELKNLQTKIDSAKQDKARIEKDILILKNSLAEEKNRYEVEKTGIERRKTELQNLLKEIEVKRAGLASSAIPEIEKLEQMKKDIEVRENILSKEKELFIESSAKLNKERKATDHQKEILKQIMVLTGNL